jgi:hypothetical protein
MMNKLLFKMIAILALLLLIVATVVNVECLYGAIAPIVLFTITYSGNVAIGRWQKGEVLNFTITVAICTDVWLVIMTIFKQAYVPATAAIGFTLGIILMGSAIKAWFIQEEPQK